MPTDRRPIVAVVIKGLGIGGAEKLISEGARHWDRTAFDYRVAYVLPWKDQLVADLEARDVPAVCVGGSNGFLPVALGTLRRQLREWKTDLVHAHLPSAGILARMVSPVPVVYTEHNMAWSYQASIRLLNRLTYARNAAITAVSEAVAESVRDYPGPEVETVPNGVALVDDPVAASRARDELDLSPDDELVVHVGNIRPGKGHDMLIDATTELLRLRPNVTVVSIGGEKHSGDLERLSMKTREAGIQNRLRFLGRRSDALSFILAADVYVNPAQFEGLPVTILEAMAAGRPVVATAVGGVPSVIQDGHNGRLVPAGSPQALADAMAEVLSNPERAERIGQAAVETVVEEYGLEPMIRRFEDIYRRLLS
jgi:glycosyltransferase involved in cell wall biosynthesis